MSAQNAIEAAVERVLLQHQRIPLFDESGGHRCTGCDAMTGEPDGSNSPRHAAHVAAEVAKALGAEEHDEQRIGIRNDTGDLEPIELGERYDMRLTPLVSLRRHIGYVPPLVGEWQEVEA